MALSSHTPAIFSSADSDLLLEMMKENLNHARHVENERMMFNTLFAALVGGSFGMLSNTESYVVNLSVLLLLLFLNVVCTVLTVRWNNVFSEHSRVAKECYLSILSARNLDESLLLYPFSNKKRTKLENFFYIHTGTFFTLFNVAITALIIVSLVYHTCCRCGLF